MLLPAWSRPGASPANAAPDELRAEVEATLRRALADMVALPCQAVRASRDAAANAARAVSRPLALSRAMIELVLGGARLRTSGAERAGAPEPGPADASGRASGAAVRAGDGQAESAGLPIEDYQSLPASHVVARLERLDRTELDAIRDFEETHRGRRTVLGRIDQLLAQR